MVARLKLVLQSPLLLSLLKPFIFGLLLFLVFLWNFNLLAVIAFFLGNFLLYIHPLLSSFVYLSSFLILIIWSLLFLGMVAGHFWLSLIVIIFFSAMFYIVIGLKNFYLIDKNYWYYLLNNCLTYLIFLFLFFRTDFYFGGKLILLTIAIFFLFREFLKIFKPQMIYRNMLAVVAALLLGELAWIISWLSIGFISASSLLFLAIYFLESLILL